MPGLSKNKFISDDGCFACGKANPWGLHLEIDAREGIAQTQWIPKRRFQGYKDLLHGGIVATLLDEIMVYAAGSLGYVVATGELTVRFKKPIPVEKKLYIEGKVLEKKSRALITEGTIKDDDGTLYATAKALLVVVPNK